MDETLSYYSQLQVLVVDEPDHIIDLGFKSALNTIISRLPKRRQTFLFAATQTKSLEDIAKFCLKDPEYVGLHERFTETKLKYLAGSYHGTTVLWARLSPTELLVGVDSLKSQRFIAVDPNHKRPDFELLRSLTDNKFIEIVPNVFATQSGDANRLEEMFHRVNKQMKEHYEKSQLPFTISLVCKTCIQYFQDSPLDAVRDKESIVFLCSWIPHRRAYVVWSVGDGMDRAVKVEENVFGSGSGSLDGLEQLSQPNASRDMNAIAKYLMKATEDDPHTGGTLRVFSLKCGQWKILFEGSVFNELCHHKDEYEEKFYDGKTMIFIIQEPDECILCPLDLERYLKNFDTGVARKSILWLCAPTGFLVYLVKLSSLECCNNWYDSCSIYGDNFRCQVFTNEDGNSCDYYLAYASREVFDRARRMTSFEDLVRED